MKFFTARLKRSAWLKFLVLMVFIGFEAALVISVWRSVGAPPSHGFLIKKGKEYVVAWHTEGSSFDYQSYRSLREALAFAHDELGLAEGRNPFWNDSLEYVSLEDRFGSYVLLWKTFQYSYLNRLTFDDQSDAAFFVSAFRRGHYSPSPFGHSVVLTPVAPLTTN